MSARIDIDGVSKLYGGFAALDRVSLSFKAGSFVVLLGPSGSGKTTLLSVLGGFTMPDGGRVLLDGADVTAMPPAIRPTTTVFQDYALFPHMTIAENVAFGLRMRKVDGAARGKRVAEMLALVGLPDTAGRKPHQLSGGQRQRVALARALAVEPQVLLLDEPLGALDLALRRQMQDELKRLQKRIGTTFVHVTHDQEEAMAIADEIVVMNKGRIEDHGPPERVYLKPKTRFAAEFMGLSTMIEGKMAEGGRAIATALGRMLVPAGHGLADGASAALSIRPEDLLTRPAEGAVALGEATILEVSFLGPHAKVTAAPRAAPEQRITLLLPHRQPAVIGASLPLFIRMEHAVLLPSGEGAS